MSVLNCTPNRDINVARSTWRLIAQIYEAVFYLQGWTDSVIANAWRNEASLSLWSQKPRSRRFQKRYILNRICLPEYTEELPPSPPKPPHVLMKFRGFPPGCGDSVADFWGWDAHEARLRCPDDVSGDMQEDEILGGALSLNLLTTQTMVTTGIFPCKEKSPW